MSQTIDKKEEYILKKSQFEDAKTSGKLVVGATYHITDDPTAQNLIDGTETSKYATYAENDSTTISDRFVALENQVETNKTNIESLTEGVDLSSFQTQLEINTAEISTEANTRASADITLQNNIDSEASARSSADTTLQSNIDSVDKSAVHITGDETITGVKTFSGKANAFTNGSYPHISGNGTRLCLSNNSSWDEGTYVFEASLFRPSNSRSGTISFGSSAAKWKDLHLSGDANVANLYVSGDIVQSGDSYVTEAEHLKVEDSLIFTRNGVDVGLGDGEYTGLVATKYDGENYGALIYDKDGVARVGDVSVTTADDGVSTITDISTQPLATRAESSDMTDTGLACWDAANQKFVTSSDVTTDDVLNSAGKIVTDASTGNVGEIFNDYTNNTASGNYSHAEGWCAIASGDYSHAEGYGTTASGSCSHAEGDATVSSNAQSHAEGAETIASNTCAHAEGYLTTASGLISHAEGYGTVASGLYSHAGSYYTTADQNYQTVVGRINKTGQSGSLFAVGNGDWSDPVTKKESTAFEVFLNGTVQINGGTITYDASTDTFTI